MTSTTVQMNRPQLPRRVAVISDVHGNRHALEAVLAAIDSSPFDEIWCLGDLVGYGAEPDACVEAVEARVSAMLVGNHDLAVIGAFDISEFSHGAAEAVRWTRATMRPESIATLQKYEPLNLDHAVALYHASPRDPIWEYVLSARQASACMDAQARRVSLVGHSHIALSFQRSDEQPASGALRPEGTTLDISEGQWILNPGAVGQPRDGDPRAAWLELDLDSWSATWHRAEYDIEGAAAAIRAAGLPASLADRLAVGQ